NGVAILFPCPEPVEGAIGAHAICTLPPVSIRKLTPSPLGRNCGRDRLRSTPDVRIFGAPPAVGMMATLFVAYQMSFGSPPRRYAIHLPSGLNDGDRSEPVQVVSWRGAAPFFGSTTKMSLLSLASGLSVRLALNAISWPSGDHTGAPSSHASAVI